MKKQIINAFNTDFLEKRKWLEGIPKHEITSLKPEFNVTTKRLKQFYNYIA